MADDHYGVGLERVSQHEAPGGLHGRGISADHPPDVLLLRDGIPSPHQKFTHSKFWGPAKIGKNILPHGFKMKWHQIGPGLVQLRLPIMVGKGCTYLCEAYVKSNPSGKAHVGPV